ncbi:hypothetical protein A4U98_07185 [Bifidobacterium animalis subsp. animalis]|nr:hypothetical protein A4U98_07185 [Bifidobacterium animalis subsp. animalis]PHQ54393.1 hypothetical protein ADH71_000890 [Bifidobacterium animalis subsp. animalis]
MRVDTPITLAVCLHAECGALDGGQFVAPQLRGTHQHDGQRKLHEADAAVCPPPVGIVRNDPTEHRMTCHGTCGRRGMHPNNMRTRQAQRYVCVERERKQTGAHAIWHGEEQQQPI